MNKRVAENAKDFLTFCIVDDYDDDDDNFVIGA